MFTVLTLGLTDEKDQKGTPIAMSEEFDTWRNAKEYLMRQLGKFEVQGYNTGQEYWWARSKADKYRVRRFFIRSSD